MSAKLLINSSINETRVAVVENGILVELYIERKKDRSILGNVYKGTVTNVLPGMQAAFVDIGLTKDAFLFVHDISYDIGEYERLMLETEEGVDIELEEGDRERVKEPPAVSIDDIIRKGQDIMVQVSKESLGTKGARVTSFMAIPGRYLVYMPQVNHIGISRRIKDEKERDRLRKIIKKIRPQGAGFIIRTVAEGIGEEEFIQDIEFLMRLWSNIQSRYEKAPSPALIHEDIDLIFRTIRDFLNKDVEELMIDSKEDYDKCMEYVNYLIPNMIPKVKFYEKKDNLLEAFGIEKEIEKALRRKVWLKSGGYIVIDQTEALVAIDVNTGKYVGKRDFEQTIFKINMEAVTEVVRQIRLRDLGGIIIIDFIDMENEENRNKVFKALKKALAADKSRTNVLQISELGLVEMTRKRMRQGLMNIQCQPCPACRGSGVVKADVTLVNEIFRKIQTGIENITGQEVLVRVNPEIAKYIQAEERDSIEDIQKKTQRKISIQSVSDMQRDEYEIICR